MPVRIVADIYEKPSGLPTMLNDLGADIEVRRLSAGDCVPAPNIVVERKTVLHLHTSIVAGSFWPQLGRLRDSAAVPFLLIEGMRLFNGPLPAESIRGAYLAVLDRGVRIVRSESTEDSARWVYRLAVRHERKRRDRPAYAQRVTGDEPSSEAMLAAVPGLSVTAARRLLERFGSVRAVAPAEPEEWTLVPGIGPIRARMLLEALGTGPASRSQHS